MQEYIHIQGATHHNLKNIETSIPRNCLVVVCGPSGSGKSTLTFDLVYSEGQRRYVESLSAYARQFLPQMDKPQVEKVEGLSPSISLQQHTTSRNPRSTVGTVSEIYDFLRVFFARLGTSYCPRCGRSIRTQSRDEILNSILKLPEKSRFYLLAPLVEYKKGTQQDLLKKLKGQGFVRVRVDGEIYHLESLPELEKNKKHNLEVVVDRLVLKSDIRKRLADSLELVLQIGDGRIIVSLQQGEEHLYSTKALCPYCNINLPTPSPQLFSFNSPQGACKFCSGIGGVEYFEPMLLVPNQGISLRQGAILPWRKEKVISKYQPSLQKLGDKWGFDLDTPLKRFSAMAWEKLFFGDRELGWVGVIPILESGQEMGKIWREELSRFRQFKLCPSCQGARLRPEALAVKIEGVNIQEFCNWSIIKALDWISQIEFTGTWARIADPIIKEIRHRLSFLVSVGLGYLSLHRNMSSLSGGEAQRIRLAGQLGSGLVGVIYVLDEPSIGLHPKDNQRLIQSLQELKQRGNTVMVVEHDEPTILSADHVLELGPGSGITGGEIVYSGNIWGLENAQTLTGKYLRGDLSIPVPRKRRSSDSYLELNNIDTNNIQGLSLSIPLNVLLCVTGVSGSGKSSLAIDTLYKQIALARGIKVDSPGKVQGLQGMEKIEKIVYIDQSPIGKTPRSNPATYTKIFDDIRALFASTPEARKRGFQQGRFSFNVKGGRCEACQGEGQIRVEMHFLPDVFVTCEVCGGKRYNKETLEVEYKGLNISQVLDLTVCQAKQLFENHPKLERKLSILEQVGLEYLKLGQPATTLSGGEAQRLKISRELGKKSLPGTMYVLDEPTTGLHMHEVGKLIQVLQELVNKGASVVVIEHNKDIILASDYVLDLGPGGGEYGGEIVAQGTPEEIMDNPNSETGYYLKPNSNLEVKA